ALVYVSGKSESIKDGVAMAKEALNSGKSKDKLDQWVKVSNI
ncbi:MAG: anthranilate phosphoribosyltransferase, partial [Candidatus Zixiibacteriota bacterium]